MSNREIQLAWDYHDRTKHSEWSIRANAYGLDWDNKPLPFKIYETIEPIPLPRQAEQTGVAALSAIAQPSAPRDRDSTPNLADLARILYFSAGITKLKQYPGGEILFRAASCTGALYEIDLYIVAGELPDLPAGIYHFEPQDFSLRRLRVGDFRGALVHATGDEPAVAHAPLTIVCSGTYWRNAWKYRTRTYRHFGWDNGTLLSNLLGVSTALGLPTRVVCGFVDDQVNRLLDLETRREVAFSMVPIGQSVAVAATNTDFPALNYPTAKLSSHEIDYPELSEIHAASSLNSEQEARLWRSSVSSVIKPEASNEDGPRDLIEQVILRRGSSRRFKREAITVDQLMIMLRASTRGIDADFLEKATDQLNELYLIVNAVDGLTAGSYFYRRGEDKLELLQEGDFRSRAQHLGLQQALPGDASVAVFLMADLKPIFARLGNRGYRAVQLEAGIIGGRLYLSAYAQRLGATGLTFFDDDVTAFFSPHAAGKSAIFLMALGKGSKS
jgi:SagB-type dehydrogenase family enzyme